MIAKKGGEKRGDVSKLKGKRNKNLNKGPKEVCSWREEKGRLATKRGGGGRKKKGTKKRGTLV